MKETGDAHVNNILRSPSAGHYSENDHMLPASSTQRNPYQHTNDMSTKPQQTTLKFVLITVISFEIMEHDTSSLALFLLKVVLAMQGLCVLHTDFRG